MRFSSAVAVAAALTASLVSASPMVQPDDCTTVPITPECTTTPVWTPKTVTVYVEPTEGCEEFLKNNPTCVYCEETCETTVTSKTKMTAYVTSTPKTPATQVVCETCEETCAAATVTVTVSTTPCTTLATVTPCAGCVEQYVTTQGQLVSSCITSTSACSTYCTETEAALCVYGAMTTTVTYPTTITYTATTSCGTNTDYCNVLGQKYPCPTTIYYETVTECATGVFTLGGITAPCPTSACSVTYPTYCPATTTYAWYSTITSACESCPVATVTAGDCSITSIKTGHKATSTYCSTPGVYTCGTETVTIATPTWYYYVELCPTQYVCSYEEWCSNNKHFIVYEYIGVYLQDVYECDVNEWEETGLWIYPFPTSCYFAQPTIAIINNIEINITVAPTWYTYTTYATETTTSTVTSTVTGSVNPASLSVTPSSPASSAAAPSSTPFALTGEINGVPVVLVALNGELQASSDPNAVATTFLPIGADGVLQSSTGDIFGLVALGDPITYSSQGRLHRRNLDIQWQYSGNVPVAYYNGAPLVYSACSTGANSSSINLDLSAVSGCASFSPVAGTPGVTPGDLTTTSSAPSAAPSTSAPVSSTSAPSGSPSASPTATSGPSAEPSASPSGVASPSSSPSPSASVNGTSPSASPSASPSSSLNNTNGTVVRRDFQRRFVY